MSWADLLLRLRSLTRPSRMDEELRDELQFHLDMAARKNAAAGVDDAEAARVARLRFGGLERVKEECRTVRGVDAVETARQDVRYALRAFRRSPGFTVTVILMIACGLSLNVAAFTLFNHYVLRPFSVDDPDSLYEVSWVDRTGLGHGFAWPDYSRLKNEVDVFSDVAAFRTVFVQVNGRPLQGGLVTGNYFAMLGVGTALGRTLAPADTTAPGQGAVIVLTHSTWRDRFGAAGDIVGRTVTLRGVQLEVVGVAKPGFTGLGEAPLDFWVPLTMARQLEAGPDLFGAERPDGLRILGRVQPNLGIGRAEAMLGAWAGRLTADRPEANRAVRAILRSKATALALTPEVLVALSPVVIVFGLVLGLTCANVANMMLARGLGRQRELGVRMALGATPRRLVRQLVTESMLLAVAAGGLALPISRAMIRESVNVMFATLPAGMVDLVPRVPVQTDARVFMFTMIVALISTILFGLVPAIQTTRGDVLLATRGDFSNTWRPVRLRTALVVTQIAICVLLLICSGVLIRGAHAISAFDVGFRTDAVIVVDVVEKLRGRLLDGLSSESVVETIAAASSTPMNGLLPTLVARTGSNAKETSAWYNRVSPEYFATLGIRIVQGRGFTFEEGTSGAAVAIVSKATAERLWPLQAAVGQTIDVDRRDSTGAQPPPRQLLSVIGVASDIVSCCVAYGKDPSLIYLPTTVEAAQTSLLIRLRGETRTVRRALDARLEARAPGAVEGVHPLDEYRAAGIYPLRAASWISSALGGLAWLLTIAGVYGVLSFMVAQRTKEIGVRMALGATSGAVLSLVLNQTIRVATAGIAVGTALALASSRVLSSKLLFINPHDSLAYAAAVILVVLAALGAAWLPARRSTRVEPTTALRVD